MRIEITRRGIIIAAGLAFITRCSSRLYENYEMQKKAIALQQRTGIRPTPTPAGETQTPERAILHTRELNYYRSILLPYLSFDPQITQYVNSLSNPESNPMTQEFVAFTRKVTKDASGVRKATEEFFSISKPEGYAQPLSDFAAVYVKKNASGNIIETAVRLSLNSDGTIYNATGPHAILNVEQMKSIAERFITKDGTNNNWTMKPDGSIILIEDQRKPIRMTTVTPNSKLTIREVYPTS